MITDAQQQSLVNKLVHIFDTSKDGLWYMGEDNTVQFYNSTFYQQFDLPLQDSVLNDWLQLVHPQDRRILNSRVQSHQRADSQRVVSQYRVLNRVGQYIWIEATGIMVTEGEETYMVGCHRDITEQKLLTEKLSYATYHDRETGLLNSKKWLEDIQHGEQPACTTIYALSIAHLNHYQRRWGKEAISGVVKTLKGCLQSFADDQSVLYRISRDVFAVSCRAPLTGDAADHLCHFLKQAFASDSGNDCVVAEDDIAIGVIALRDLNGSDPLSLLLKTVEYAYRHKKISSYHGEVKHNIDRFFAVIDALGDAISGGQITIALQPIVEAGSKKLVSFEALARWTDPQLGMVRPDEFIPIAEKQGLISALGLAVLRKTCLFLKTYDSSHSERPMVNVNVSVVQLLDGQFAKQAEEIVRAVGLEPQRVVFEITESHLLDFEQRGVEQLQVLNRHGFSLSLDDFGAGFSSLTSVFRLPLAQIKIDKELVSESLSSTSCRDFIIYLVGHCQSHDIQLLAEGIETPEMEKALTELGVGFLQGYGIARPGEPNLWLDDSKSDN